MAEFQVVQAHKDEDLSEFSRFLWHKGVSHRIVRQDDSQFLLVGNEQHAMQVALAYRSLKDGELKWHNLPDQPAKPKPSPLNLLRRFPVTLIAVLLSIAGYLLVVFDGHLGLAAELTFFEIGRSGGDWVFSLPKGEPWRLITPVFLHFSILHIVFNMLWLWDLGRRVELVQSSSRLFGIMLVIALGSNLGQAMYADVGIFGGMSGVIYGLLGYCWVWSQLLPHRSMQVPTAIVLFMLGWLVICLYGFTELMGLGRVANAAHVGGLVMGLVIGLGAALIEGKKTNAGP